MPLPLLRIGGDVPKELAEAIDRLVDHVLELEREIETLKGHPIGAAGSTVAVVQSGGISEAADDDHPGVGNVMLRILGGDIVLRDSGIVVPCYNIAKGAAGGVAAGKQIITSPVYNKPGHQFVVVDPCPPA